MAHPKLACLIGAALLIAGCNDGRPSPMSGVYTPGPQVSTFRPCGGKQTFSVLASDEILTTLRAAHERLASAPAQSILVQAILRHSGRPPEGAAKRYDGNIGIVQVLDARAQIPKSCLETDWSLPGRRRSYVP